MLTLVTRKRSVIVCDGNGSITSAMFVAVLFLTETQCFAQNWTLEAGACVAPAGAVDVQVFADSGAVAQYTLRGDVIYNPAELALDPTFGDRGILIGSQWLGLVNPMLSIDSLRFSGFALAPPTGRVLVATIRFVRIGGSGSTTITGSVIEWTQPGGMSIRAIPFSMQGDVVDLACGSLPTCVIREPAATADGNRPVEFVFDTFDADLHGLDTWYEFNPGGGFVPATRLGGGTSFDPGVLPALGLSFTWDTDADFVSAPGRAVLFRITVEDPTMQSAACELEVRIEDFETSCAIWRPEHSSTTTTPSTLIVFDAFDLQQDPLTISYEYNFGIFWFPATRAGGGSSVDVGVLPQQRLSFAWDLVADLAFIGGNGEFRVSVTDGSGPASTCRLRVNIGSFANANPTCAITAPIMGASVVAPVMVLMNLADANGDPLTISYEVNSGSGFQPATRFGGGAPIDSGVMPTTGHPFLWNVSADAPIGGSNIRFRANVDDGAGGFGFCEVRVDHMNPNQPPSCAITAPLPGAMLGGATLVTFDTMDADADPLDITYEFDSGSGFAPASRVGGGASVDLAVPPALGLTFNWNAPADLMAGATTVDFRITLNDQRGGVTTCMVTVDGSGAIGGCPVPPTLCGDCNGDLVLSILDALVAAQISAGLISPGPAQSARCNVNGLLSPAPGATVDILDALTLAQAAAGLPATLVCC